MNNLKFRAWLKKPQIMIDNIAVYPGGAIGIEVEEIIKILDKKYDGQIYTDKVENIESVKERVKVENKGVKQKDLDKATKKILHKYKDSMHYSFVESILNEFKSIL